MSADWPRRPVAELQDNGLLLVEDGNHGEYRPRSEEFGEGAYAFVRAADMSDGRVLFDSAQRINDVAFTRIRKGVGRGGDVLFSHKGTVGKLAMVPLDAPPFVCSPQTTFWRTLDERRLDRCYLYYFMRSKEFTEQWMARKGETDMADYVSLTAQRQLNIALPAIDTQRAIAGVLGALDDKIEQNRRTARALERLARAIFRAWFVDFEPVKAKAAGATSFPSMPQAVFNTLPTRFADSKIGPFPEGWTTKKIGDLIELAYGKPLKADQRVPGPFPVFGANGMIGWHEQPLVGEPGIVIGRKGNPGTVEWSDRPFFPIDTTFYVVRLGKHPLTWLFYELQKQNLGRLTADSAVPGLNRNAAYSIQLVVAPRDVLLQFDQIISPLWALRSWLRDESVKLAEIRNYLLPKLLSGEVRVDVSQSEALA